MGSKPFEDSNFKGSFGIFVYKWVPESNDTWSRSSSDSIGAPALAGGTLHIVLRGFDASCISAPGMHRWNTVYGYDRCFNIDGRSKALTLCLDYQCNFLYVIYANKFYAYLFIIEILTYP